jgi:hypothetical protein
MAEAGKKYTQRELEELIEKTTGKGAVYVELFFDAHGKDAEEVQAALVEFVSRLTKEKGVIYCVGKIMEPYSQLVSGSTTFSTSAQVMLLAENFNKLHDVCIRYSPVGLQLLSPKRITLSLEEAHSLLLDDSANSTELSRILLQRVLKPEQYAKEEERFKRKADLGRKLLANAKEKAAGTTAPAAAPSK